MNKLMNGRQAMKAERIPEMWLCGRTQMRMREGLNVMQARAQAIRDWQEQERLEREFLAGR
jgi:hypothetical protein